MRSYLRPLRELFFGTRSAEAAPRGRITNPGGKLPIGMGPLTCVIVVGTCFDQEVPNAMMTFRMGYAAAFEELGIPYLILDQQDLADTLPELPRPFCMVNGSDFLHMDRRNVGCLLRYPHSVWVDPWFQDSDRFFAAHGLDASIWTWSDSHRRKILDAEPAFVHTATVPSGLNFFSTWEQHGMKLVSLPLACDTALYCRDQPESAEFDDVRMTFVGGYWESKGRQLDRYLRPFEDELVIYGYSPWPYRGYRGKLAREAEPALYRRAIVSPVINEPTVALLHGQINERIFKVLGAGGCPLVDAVQWYRELFSEDELFIPRNEQEFYEMATALLADHELREKHRQGREAVLTRHTYRQRALKVLDELGLADFGRDRATPPTSGEETKGSI